MEEIEWLVGCDLVYGLACEKSEVGEGCLAHDLYGGFVEES